jgi:hypothetical protein
MYVAYALWTYSLFVAAAGRLYGMAFNCLAWHKQVYITTSPYSVKLKRSQDVT